jgi:hypothetical protein
MVVVAAAPDTANGVLVVEDGDLEGADVGGERDGGDL